jgi:hypothetical protein
MKEQRKLMRLKAFSRAAWMNDTQHAIYVEMTKVSEAMFEAMLTREHEKWLKLSLRMREITRMAHDHIFVD